MMARRWARVGIIGAASLFLISCASTKINNIENGGGLTLEDDEAGIWQQSKELEKALLKSNFIYRDEVLTAYVNKVLRKVIAGEADPEMTPRAYILGDPNFNAATMPDGVMFVYTGLLANLDNEAQLATVLGHEATHFLHRHALRQKRSLVNKTAFLSFVQISAVAGAGALAYSGYDPRGVDLLGDFVQLGVAGSVYGYGRDLEREADKEGFRLIREAGYDPRESKKAFENLDAATKGEKKLAPYFFQTHPKVKERIRNFDKYLKEFSKTSNEEPDGVRNTDEYIHMIKDVLLFNAELDVKRNRPKIARRQLEKYDTHFPGDYKARFLSGEVFKEEGETAKALEELEKSIALKPDFPDSRRELGLLYWKAGQKPDARKQFEKYLSLRPDAQDAGYIKGYLHD